MLISLQLYRSNLLLPSMSSQVWHGRTVLFRLAGPPYCYIAKSIIFAKIFKLRVGLVCQYLLLWQLAVRSPQRGLQSVTLANLPGTKYGDRLNVLGTRPLI